MKNNTTADVSMIPVDIGKLNGSLATLFHSIAHIFESVGVEGDNSYMEKQAIQIDGTLSVTSEDPPEDSEKAASSPEKVQEATVSKDKPTATSKDTSTAVPKDKPASESKDTPGAESSGGEKQKNTDSKKQYTTTLKHDDLTKVIVAKIEQDRKNSDRIGALIKSYGVDKLSQLEPSDYEAFMTDISQL